MKNVGDEQNQCAVRQGHKHNVGASPATAVAARRRGAPRGTGLVAEREPARL
jgi:hypothetical protein